MFSLPEWPRTLRHNPFHTDLPEFLSFSGFAPFLTFLLSQFKATSKNGKKIVFKKSCVLADQRAVPDEDRSSLHPQQEEIAC